MISNEVVEAQQRESRGKNEARRLRAGGEIPGVVYGAKKDAVSVTVNPKQITRILHSETGHNTIFDLKLGAGTEKVMIVDWQYEPIKGRILHIDMKRIAMDKVIRVSVPIVLTGEAFGVKQEGGIMDQVLREVEIECLPADIPSAINIDVTEMKFGDVVRVSDLPHGGTLKFLTDEGQAVAHVTAVKEEVVAAPVDAAAAAATPAAPAEPEVIKKGKQETDEAAAAPAAKK